MSFMQGPSQARGRFRPREKAAKQPPLNITLNKDIREYVIATNRSTNTGHWNEKPEVPSPNEILGLDGSLETTDVIDLVPNQIRGPWPAVHTYLKAHYDLLREDAVSPLRDAVAYFKETPSMGDSASVSVYEKVWPSIL
jgi:helicase required for RNAi-mediated heterochromatin assembly 1